MYRFFIKFVFSLLAVLAVAETLPSRPVAPSILNNDETSKDFSRALNLLNAGLENEAEVSFSDFLRRHPAHDLCDNAVYWLAEINFRRHKFEEAVLGFRKVLKFKDSIGESADAIPMAIVRLSESLLKVGKKREAIIELQALIRKFPQSEGAQEAQVLLAGLVNEKS